MQLDVDPMSGEDLQKLVADLYATSPRLVERARQALAAKPPAAPAATVTIVPMTYPEGA